MKLFFIIEGDPVAKPRQTQRDRWRKRPCVVKYRKWADIARESFYKSYISLGARTVRTSKQLRETPIRAEHLLKIDPVRVIITAFFAFPKTYPKKKREGLKGKPHRLKPDGDNVLKAVSDALFKQDQRIAYMAVDKKWDDGYGPRIEVLLEG